MTPPVFAQRLKCALWSALACVLLTGPRPFAAAEAESDVMVPFTEEAQSRGISYAPDQFQLFGDGLAFADLDGDGDADVVLLGNSIGTVGVYENDGEGHFIDRSFTCGIPLLPDHSGVVAGDYDRDGDLDLYISRLGAANKLYRNGGGFQFVDMTDTAGVGDADWGTGCAWGDIDNDGWIDLFVANRVIGYFDPLAPNRLYQNQGDGTFVDVAVALGVEIPDEGSFQASFFDFDRDADADLYICTIRGFCDAETNAHGHLFENVGGTFVDITDASGTAACGVDAMCVALGDFDGNGWQDIYITNTPPGNALLMNQGDGTFRQEEGIANVASYATGWGAEFFDFDNDGILDLYVCNTFGQQQPNRLYKHNGAWPCTDVSQQLGVDVAGNSYAVATADIDDDGDLDMLVGNRNEHIRLFINHEGETRRWAKFDVYGRNGNRYALGANVRVRTGGIWRIREVIAGNNFKTQNDLILHFGLNDALVMDEVEVIWPGGTTRTLTGLETDRTWILVPPERLGDSDNDGDIDIQDINALVNILLGLDLNPLRTALSDMNGDGTVNGDDIPVFLQVLLL